MSCFRIRLLTAKKAWKTFTSKIQTKLHKLHKPKTKRNSPKNLVPGKTAKSSGRQSSLILLGRRFKRKKHRPILSKRMLKAKTEAVYIDQLFKEPVTELVLENPYAKPARLVGPVEGVRISGGPDRRKVAKVEDEAPGTSGVGDGEETLVEDDMWESVGLGSPQMQGIDERAEEFITRFRAEMELQEIIARNL